MPASAYRKSSQNIEIGNDWDEYFLNTVVSMNLMENSSSNGFCQSMEKHDHGRYLKCEIVFITIEHETTSRYLKCIKRFGHRFHLYLPIGFSKKTIIFTDGYFIFLFCLSKEAE